MDSIGAGLGHQAWSTCGDRWTAMWGESGLLAGRVMESCHLFSCRFIYELERFNGVAELLEILGR